MAMLFVAALAIGFKVIVDEESAKIRSVVQTSRAGVFIIAIGKKLINVVKRFQRYARSRHKNDVLVFAVF
jgi:hypothetical protein